MKSYLYPNPQFYLQKNCYFGCSLLLRFRPANGSDHDANAFQEVNKGSTHYDPPRSELTMRAIKYIK